MSKNLVHFFENLYIRTGPPDTKLSFIFEENVASRCLIFFKHSSDNGHQAMAFQNFFEISQQEPAVTFKLLTEKNIIL
jgi:hypothetical protein